MNTDKNSYTATQSGTPAQPEQTVPDSNHAAERVSKWLVRIVRGIQLEGDVEVEANDYWAAIAEAEKQPMSAVKQWKLMFDSSSADLDSGALYTGDEQEPDDPELAALLKELAEKSDSR